MSSVLSKVTNQAKPQPPRVVLYAAEKFGKTSWATHAWKPIFLMTQGETGLKSLLEAGRVPAVDHFPDDFQSWGELLRAVRALKDDPHDYRTLVIDTGNGAELMCQAAVCADQFNNNWGEFLSYGRGNEQATKEWAKFLAALDEVREARRMAVVILHHAKVKTFSDPAGKDWDQWRPECVDKLWALTHKWADVILFGGFKVSVNRDDNAVSESRYLRAEVSGSIVAGNRYGLPAELTAPAGAANLWKAFADALTKAKANGRPPAAKETTAAPPAQTRPQQKPTQPEPDEDDGRPGVPAPADSDNMRARAKHVNAFAQCKTEAERQAAEAAYLDGLIHLSQADRDAVDAANEATQERLQGAA